MEEQFEQRKSEWLAQNGFSEDGYTYVIKGETFSIKDELKAAGYRYHPILLWHKAFPDEKYAGRHAEVAVDAVVAFSAWGAGTFKASAAAYVKGLTVEAPTNPSLEWAGMPGDSIKEELVQLVRKSSFNGKYGLTNVITFVDKRNLKYTWFTTSTPTAMIGDWVILNAKIKKNDFYQGEKITTITRARLKEV